MLQLLRSLKAKPLSATMLAVIAGALAFPALGNDSRPNGELIVAAAQDPTAPKDPPKEKPRRPRPAALPGVAPEEPTMSLATNDVRDISNLLAPIRAQNKAPGVAAVVVRPDRIIAWGSTGVRKTGDPTPVTLQDRWHIGSVSKPMTATLAARLIEQKKISWTSTVGEIFPNLAAGMNSDWRSVTLEMLLSHRSGVSGRVSSTPLWDDIWRHAGNAREQRRYIVERLTAVPPDAKPNAHFEYSNAGYIVVGAMLEEAVGKPWEQLAIEQLFIPLGMTAWGFGPPGDPSGVTQPWGHVSRNGVLTAMVPGPGSDNPAAIGPAGTIHCSVIDLGRFAALHLRTQRNDSTVVSTNSLARLQTDVAGQKYALGWGIWNYPWAGGILLHASGSNGNWQTTVWLLPNKNLAIAVTTNVGGPAGESVATDVCQKMAQTFL